MAENETEVKTQSQPPAEQAEGESKSIPNNLISKEQVESMLKEHFNKINATFSRLGGENRRLREQIEQLSNQASPD